MVKVGNILEAIRSLNVKAVQDARAYKQTNYSHSKRIAILIAATIVLTALCGFAVYELGLFDLWLQKVSVDPIKTVQSAIEGQAGKEYTIAVRIDDPIRPHKNLFRRWLYRTIFLFDPGCKNWGMTVLLSSVAPFGRPHQYLPKQRYLCSFQVRGRASPDC